MIPTPCPGHPEPKHKLPDIPEHGILGRMFPILLMFPSLEVQSDAVSPRSLEMSPPDPWHPSVGQRSLFLGVGCCVGPVILVIVAPTPALLLSLKEAPWGTGCTAATNRSVRGSSLDTACLCWPPPHNGPQTKAGGLFWR